MILLDLFLFACLFIGSAWVSFMLYVKGKERYAEHLDTMLEYKARSEAYKRSMEQNK